MDYQEYIENSTQQVLSDDPNADLDALAQILVGELEECNLVESIDSNTVLRIIYNYLFGKCSPH